MSSDNTNSDPAQGTRSAELITTMLEQERICDRLLELSAAERAAVMDGQVERLEESTCHKADLIEQMDRLERKRGAISDQLAGDLKLHPRASLMELAGILGGQEGKDLLELRDRVSAKLAKLRESNDSNLRLMRKSLDLVRESMRQLRHSAGAENSYNSSGRTSPGVRGSIAVDCHA